MMNTTDASTLSKTLEVLLQINARLEQLDRRIESVVSSEAASATQDSQREFELFCAKYRIGPGVSDLIGTLTTQWKCRNAAPEESCQLSLSEVIKHWNTIYFLRLCAPLSSARLFRNIWLVSISSYRNTPAALSNLWREKMGKDSDVRYEPGMPI